LVKVTLQIKLMLLMRQNNHRDLISQFQWQKIMLCLKILAYSVGHMQKWLTVEKAKKQCRTD